MYTDTEKAYLLKAVDAFQRRFSVISSDFKILATNRPNNENQNADMPGATCYQNSGQKTDPPPWTLDNVSREV